MARLVSSAGRIGLNLLQRMVQAVSAEDFTRFMQKPVLAGSAIHLGDAWRPGPRNGSRDDEPHDCVRARRGLGEDAVLGLREPEAGDLPLDARVSIATSTGEVFSIGRIDGNDFIMPGLRHLQETRLDSKSNAAAIF
ncbi:MAG: hypothetical protein MZV70_15165 [Desulfobacterales bacterium]|nr:hypothetical protein [Desulfobacterales bacterium]